MLQPSMLIVPDVHDVDTLLQTIDIVQLCEFFDYGPTPLDIFNMECDAKVSIKVVEELWRKAPCDKTNAMLNMMMKLKFLKAKIREWNKSNMLSMKNVKAKYKEELEALEAIIDRGDDLREYSHLFYADDAVFMGQWCDGNISTLIHVLECFYRASGLRINMSKSKILGVNVDSDKVKGTASKLGCLILKTPFTYLGSKVGGSMSRVHAWNEVIDRVKNQLSKWKMKTLSIGGRLTLLKSVLGSIPIFHMSIYRAPLSVLRTLESIRSKKFKGHDINSNKASWVNWKKVLASKEKGGLRVSSLFDLYRGLMFKWIWRFYTQNTLLWVRVVKAIHGDDGNVGGHVKSGAKSCWLDIVRETHALKTKERRGWRLRLEINSTGGCHAFGDVVFFNSFVSGQMGKWDDLGELGRNFMLRQFERLRQILFQRGLMFHAEVLILIPLCVLFVIMGWETSSTCSSIVDD
ncbi:hypothetical protein Tco_0786983 [Tanacetum coccineum]